MCLFKDLRLSEDTQALLRAEYDRAVLKHGPAFPSLQKGISVLLAEVDEVLAAYRKRDIYGKHGIKNETMQVVVVCFKILEGLPEVEE
jgi:hypothetical protein